MVGQRMKPQENVSFRLKTLCLGQKNSEKNICFPQKKLFFLPSVEKTTIFSSGNKSSPQSFSVPGIMFPARRNIYSLKFSSQGSKKTSIVRLGIQGLLLRKKQEELHKHTQTFGRFLKRFDSPKQ